MNDRQPISDSDTDADSDSDADAYSDSDADSDAYANADEYIMKMSETSVHWTTKEEAYLIMSKGFFINDDDTKRGIWFSLDENGKKCLMLSPRVVDTRSSLIKQRMLSISESRFGEAYGCDDTGLHVKYDIGPQLLSPRTRYAIYLVYKLSEDQSGWEVPMRVSSVGSKTKYIYLVSPPQIPVIKPKADQNTHSPHSKLMKKCYPQQRNDGWMEAQLLKFQSARATKVIYLFLFSSKNFFSTKIRGLYIEGIEIRPI